MRNRVECYRLIHEVTSQKPQHHWIEGLTELGVPCGPINDMTQVFEDPQVLARGMKIAMPHPLAGKGTVELIGNPVKLSETPVDYHLPPPFCGQHTDQVLREMLHMSDDDLARAAGEEGDLRRALIGTLPVRIASAPAAGLPQPAERLDASLPIRANELLIEVACAQSRFLLHAADRGELRRRSAAHAHAHRGDRAGARQDAQSGHRLRRRAGRAGGGDRPDFPRTGVAVGDDDLHAGLADADAAGSAQHRRDRHQGISYRVEGHAILFASGLFTRLPNDIPQQTGDGVVRRRRRAGPRREDGAAGRYVCVLGSGRAGLLSLCAARQAMGPDGTLIGLDASSTALRSRARPRASPIT